MRGATNLAAAAVVLASATGVSALQHGVATEPRPVGLTELPGLLESSAPGNLRIFLMIAGPGDDVLSRFGHAALWIRDESRDIDVAVNYGLSDTRQPGFFRQLLLGTVVSRAAIRPPRDMIQLYATVNRSVEVVELTLADAEKVALLNHLASDLSALRGGYAHDFYRANCTTFIRDAIDASLGGELQRRSQGISVHTYRSLTTGSSVADPWLHLVISGLLGRRADAPITVWEAMFLPTSLVEGLRTTEVNHGGGSTPLVASRVVVYASDRGRPRNDTRALAWMWFGLGCAIAGGLIVITRARGGFSVLSRLAVTIGLLVLGTAGLTMVLLWAIWEQPWAMANENLLQSHPAHLVAALMLWGPEPERRALRRLVPIIGIASLGGVLINLAPIGSQGNELFLAIAVPVNLGVTAALWRLTSWGLNGA
jgi:hypothetical protein